jgi:hypothetical protein
MLRIQTIARSAAAALALALTAAPLTALADEPAAGAHHDHGRAREDHAKMFPMRGEAFRELVARRTDKAREHMDRMLAARKLPDALAAQVRRDFEAGAAKVKAAAEKVAQKGSVSLEDAREIRKLARDLIAEARAKYGLPKGEHPKGRHDRSKDA